MSDVQDYKSSLNDPTSRKFETFSYLPTMEAVEIRRQVEYIISNRTIKECRNIPSFVLSI